jgi:hypothetical protein
MEPQLHRIQCCAYKVLSNPSAELTMEQLEEFIKHARKEQGHDNVHQGFTTIVTYTHGDKKVIKNLKTLGFEPMEAEGNLGDMELWQMDVQKIHPWNRRSY